MSQSHSHDHSHSHGHGHGHHHHHARSGDVKQLRRVLFLTFLFMGIEGVGGYYTNSLALMSDAIHLLTDTAAIGLSLFAIYISHRPATDAKTFGYHRTEILAAFVNGIFLVLLSCGIIWGAWERYQHPVDVLAPEMFGLSSLGFFFNVFGAWLLLKGDRENLNVRGALFHVAGDALGALGAMIAAALIYFLGWKQADPVVSIVIAFVIIASSFRLLLDTAHVILEGTPHHLNIDEIRKSIGSVELVREVHDLHVWSITSGMVSLSVHVVAKLGASGHHPLLCKIRDLLREEYQIEHVTIQIEDESLKTLEPSI